MKTTQLLIALLIFQFTFSQENVNSKYEISTTYEQIRARKGQFFASWGWNRGSYTPSNISFKGDDFDFTLYNVKADDKPKPFGIDFLDPGGLTLPQTNLELGYFFNDNYNIVLGYDHMKYVLRNGQNVKIKGEIARGNYLFDNEIYNFDGVSNYNLINLSRPFILFEHTDGLNYVFVGVNRFDSLNKLFHINTENFEINIEEGFDFGFVMPKTNTTILGNKRYDEFHVAGFGLSASAGINFTFFKHFFLKTDFKYGYISMGDIRITNNSSEKAEQHFDFAETSYTFGYRFNPFSTKTKSTTLEVSDFEKDTKALNTTKPLVSNSKSINKIDSKPIEKTDSKPVEIAKSKTDSDTTTCPDKKALEYKEKSTAATSKPDQKAYGWLALYYKYKCKCENGSKYPDSLVALINNVVDNYNENTNGSYEKISKVSTCTGL